MSESQSRQDERKDSASRLRVVGIGGSAGSIPALKAFFEEIPPDCGIAFIVVLHLSPDHKSELASILQGHTKMPVVQVQGRTRLERDHVYLIPPGKSLQLADGHLSTEDFQKPRGERMPIDIFFRSHAQHHADGVAIVLSGNGNDGAAGIKHVKEVGALVMAQDPDEAEFDSMPRAAVATGVVDIIAPVRELAQHVVDYVRRSDALIARPADHDSEVVLQRILSKLLKSTRHDFSGYKEPTVLRRIARRMHVVGTDTLEAYDKFLTDNEAENRELFRDLLISVTSFFRDPQAWKHLEAQIIPQLFENRSPEDTIRIWVAGCATGEEAYSVAMLVAEEAERHRRPPQFQIFASDLDERAIMFARDGVYPGAIREEVSEPRLHRWFEEEDEKYRVSRRLREHILIAPHNLLRDPPFSRLDLITCRNVLIYLQQEVQLRVLSLFENALEPEGFLFLGSSESADDAKQGFSPVDKAARTYRRRGGSSTRRMHPPNFMLPGLPRVDPRPRPHDHRIPFGATDHLRDLEAHAPPSVVVSAAGAVLHVSPRAGRYLVHPAGPITSELLETIRPELQDSLRGALFDAFSRGEATTSRAIHVRFNGETGLVHLIVAPIEDDGETRALVLFAEVQDVEHDETTALSPGLEARELEREVERSRDELRAMTEKYEMQREEMQAHNEELQSMNEEYRSATEELETSKEELQSTNEELQTVNDELSQKVDEVSRAHADLSNLIDATQIATIFLDPELRIRRFTPNTSNIFNIRTADVGRPLGDLNPRFAYPDLLNDATRSFENLESIEKEAQSRDGRWYSVRHRPYRDGDRIAGVLITFIEITGQKESEAKAQHAYELAQAVVDTVRDGLLVLDDELRVLEANRPFYRMFSVSPSETEGRLIYELGNAQWDIPVLRTALEQVLPRDEVVRDLEITHQFENIGKRTMMLNARRLQNLRKILLVIDDVTDRRQ